MTPTKSTKKNLRHITPAIQWCTFLAIVYCLLIFLLPANHITMQIYHLNPLEYRLILFLISLPSILVWFAAFWGYAALRKYAHALRKTPEGVHFDKLSKGATWLAWSLPLPTIIAILLNAIANNTPNFHPSAIIIFNYISLLLPLVAFSLIGSATRGLLTTAKLKFSLTGTRSIMVVFLAFGVLYCYLTFRRFDLTSLAVSNNAYFLPIWLMVLTVIVPYLYAWFVGLLGAYEMALFSKNVQGLLYRRALRYLVVGLFAVIVSSIALQYINGVEPRVGQLVFDLRLIANTAFRVIGGVGYVLIALGATRLKKIEEV